MSMKKRSGVSRRALLKSAGTTALMAAAASEFPFGVHIAQAAGPLISGVLRDWSGDYRLSLVVFAVLGGLSVAAALMARRPGTILP